MSTPRRQARTGRARRLATRTLLALALAAIAPAVQADCDCQDTDLDGYPDRDDDPAAPGQACTGSSISIASHEVNTPAQATLVITWTLGARDDGSALAPDEYQCGQFANGDYWVAAKTVSAEAGVAVDLVDPAWDGDGNGFDIDPVRILTATNSPAVVGGEQSWDVFVGSFAAAGPRPLPHLLFPDETLISTIKRRGNDALGGLPGDNEDPCDGNDNKPCIHYAAALTAVAAPVAQPTTAFRPPYGGSWDPLARQRLPSNKPVYRTTSIDWSKFRSFACPASDPGCTSENLGVPRIDIMTLRNRYRNLHLDTREHAGGRKVRPFAVWGQHNYGGHWAIDTAVAALRMSIDDFDPVADPVARQMVINYVQTGIDYYHLAVDADKIWPDGGGLNQGARILVWAAAYFLDDPAMKAWLASAESQTHFAETLNIYRSGRTRYSDSVSPPWDPEWSKYFGGSREDNTVVLFGQTWGQPRKDGTSHDGLNRCADNNNQKDGLPNPEDSTCRDPYHLMDGQGDVCRWDDVLIDEGLATEELRQGAVTDYAAINHCGIVYSALAVRLLPGGHDVWGFDESYEYAVRRAQFGFWMRPDTAWAEAQIGNKPADETRVITSGGADPDPEIRKIRCNDDNELLVGPGRCYGGPDDGRRCGFDDGSTPNWPRDAELDCSDDAIDARCKKGICRCAQPPLHPQAERLFVGDRSNAFDKHGLFSGPTFTSDKRLLDGGKIFSCWEGPSLGHIQVSQAMWNAYWHRAALPIDDVCQGADVDADLVCDGADNCPGDPNGPTVGPDDQGDADLDGVGNVCECSYQPGAPPVPDGDVDRSLIVDDSDYDVWAANYLARRQWEALGVTLPPATYEEGDLNCNGDVDIVDYTIWADDYGTDWTGGSAASAPPACGLGAELVLLAALLPALRSRRQRLASR